MAVTDRKTPELVIGLVGPIGSGVSTVSSLLARMLREELGYEADIVKVSKIIEDNADKIRSQPSTASRRTERITRLQNAGNALRRRFGEAYLAEKAVEGINRKRIAARATDVSPPELRRVAHIVDALKNPAEVAALRDVYRPVFWLIAVFAPEEVRLSRFPDQAAGAMQEIFRRDEAETVESGQKVRDTVQEADFFVRNDGHDTTKLLPVLRRFLETVFSLKVVTPTRDESGMHHAAAASTRSACLSRQVGASIMSPTGELLSVGWNDVPQKGGGLYSAESTRDNRCFAWDERDDQDGHRLPKGICHNDREKELLYVNLEASLREAGLIDASIPPTDVVARLKFSRVRSLIEFSRSVHAEMEAIVSIARSGGTSVRGATMFTTTYSCHSCARHIVAAGIVNVVYIEPYPKSLAFSLHGDAITHGESPDKVAFRQFEGFAPRNFDRLFVHRAGRKENGLAKTSSPTHALPMNAPSIDGFTKHEELVVAKLYHAERLSETIR